MHARFRSTPLPLVAALALCLAAGCVESDDDTPDVVDTHSVGDTGDTHATSDVAQPCLAAEAIADPGEVDLTPRADGHLEFIALACSEGLASDTTVYEQLVDDLEAIFAVDESLRAFRHYDYGGVTGLEHWVPRVSISVPDAPSGQRILDDPEFQCLTERLGGEAELYQSSSRDGVIVSFGDRLYRPEPLAELYTALTAVESAFSNSSVERSGDGGRLYYDADGSPRQVLYSYGFGDCSSGCIGHRYTLWQIDDQGMASRIAEWVDDPANDVREPAPESFSFGDFECAY